MLVKLDPGMGPQQNTAKRQLGLYFLVCTLRTTYTGDG